MVAQFCELADYRVGKTPSRANPEYWPKKTNQSDGVPWVAIGDMDNFARLRATAECISEKAFKEVFRGAVSPRGTLLMSFKLTIGRVTTLDVDACHNEAIISIFPKRERVDQQYLEYYLSQIDYAEYQDRAVKGNTLNQEKIDRLAIALPPLVEQRAIASVLNRVRRAIDCEEHIISHYRETNRSVVGSLFTRGMRGGEQRDSDIGPIPKEWNVLPCEAVCEVITVGVVVKPASHYVPHGVPAFRSLNVRENRLDLDNLVYFSSEANDGVLAKSKLRAGDVLVVRTGYPGTSCVVPDELDGSNCIDIVIVRPKRDFIESSFLSRFLNSEAGRHQALRSKTGLAQQHLNVGAVKQTIVPVPALQEQREMCEILGSLDRAVSLHEKKLAKFHELFGKLRHDLLTGEVRVDQVELPEASAA